MSEIDLKKYQIRTDLIVESIGSSDIEGITKREKEIDDIRVTDIIIDEDIEELNKKKGRYITVGFKDITDTSNRKKVEDVVIKELASLLQFMHIDNNSSCLVIGLGNYKSTPDSLGPKVVKDIDTTRHLLKYAPEYIDPETRSVTAIAPGVLGTTGIETVEIIKGIYA